MLRVMACFSALAYRNLSLLLKLEQKASSNFDILDKSKSILQFWIMYTNLVFEQSSFVNSKVLRVMACFSALAYRNLSLLLKLEQKASSNFDILDKRGQEGSEGVHKWRTSISETQSSQSIWEIVWKSNKSCRVFNQMCFVYT